MSILDLSPLSPQESFPFEDVSSDNVDTLALLLLNSDIVREGSTMADTNSWLYRIGRLTISSVISHYYDDGAQLNAVHDGIEVFKAMSSLITPIIDDDVHNNTFEVHPAVLQFGANLQENIVHTTYQATDHFENLPNAKGLVIEHARRFQPGYEDYSVIGASLVCELLYSATETIARKLQ